MKTFAGSFDCVITAFNLIMKRDFTTPAKYCFSPALDTPVVYKTEYDAKKRGRTLQTKIKKLQNHNRAPHKSF